MPAQKRDPPGYPAGQKRNVQVARMVRRYQDSPRRGNVFAPNDPVPEEQSPRRVEQHPEETINQTAHSLDEITAIMRSMTCATVSADVSILSASGAGSSGATSRVRSCVSRSRKSCKV